MQENLRKSTVTSSQTTTIITWNPTPVSPGPVPSSCKRPPPLSPVGGVTSGSCGGLLVTGPDNQRVCKCQVCDFQNFVYGQGFKGRYFYGNCRWSILLYIYVINMWLNLSSNLLFGLLLVLSSLATSCAGWFSHVTNKFNPTKTFAFVFTSLCQFCVAVWLTVTCATQTLVIAITCAFVIWFWNNAL